MSARNRPNRPHGKLPPVETAAPTIERLARMVEYDTPARRDAPGRANGHHDTLKRLGRLHASEHAAAELWLAAWERSRGSIGSCCAVPEGRGTPGSRVPADLVLDAVTRVEAVRQTLGDEAHALLRWVLVGGVGTREVVADDGRAHVVPCRDDDAGPLGWRPLDRLRRVASGRTQDDFIAVCEGLASVVEREGWR